MRSPLVVLEAVKNVVDNARVSSDFTVCLRLSLELIHGSSVDYDVDELKKTTVKKDHS